MQFRTFVMALFILPTLAFAGPGRSPAVEDFIGIEIEHPDTSPQGKDSLYNLEQDIQKLEKVEAKAYQPQTATPPEHQIQPAPSFTQWSAVNVFAWTLLLGLPLMSWYMAVTHLKRKASLESASNIEVLEKYRRERELARKKEEEFRKVS